MLSQRSSRVCTLSARRRGYTGRGHRRGCPDGARPALPTAKYWAVEVKRVAGLDAVEQLTRYVEPLNRDPLLAPVGGILAAQTIKPQARMLAEDRRLRCVALDYEALRGMDPTTPRLF
jgi:endonuclease